VLDKIFHRCGPFLLLAILPAGLLMSHAGCSSGAAIAWPLVRKAIRMQYPSVPQLSTQELAEWLARSDSTRPVLLDVRAPEEHAISHLREARLAPTLQEALDQLADAAPDAPVVAYCSVGYRSSALVRQLQAEGYTRVYSLEGSIFKWANEGFPLYRGADQVQVVHPYAEPWSWLLQRKLRARRK